MKEYEAHVESNGAGWYSVYCNEEFPFGFFGEGATVEEAERDFLATFDAFRAEHKERTGEDVQASFKFVKDMSAVLQECIPTNLRTKNPQKFVTKNLKSSY